MGSGMKGNTTEDNQVSLPEWRKKLIEREFSLFKDQVSIIWAKQFRLCNRSNSQLI